MITIERHAATLALAEQSRATLVGRVFRPELGGPSVVRITDGRVFDISASFATVRDLCETEDPAGALRAAVGEDIGAVADLLIAADPQARDGERPYFLAPVDLQALKAAGVTFVASMLERVIEERIRGDANAAAGVRATVEGLVGRDLKALKPGSADAAKLKTALIEAGAWSQYLEVGIGPDAEIFTKGQPLSAVGTGAEIGVHPASTWNNPEPEIVLVGASSGRIVGATLGNDVNLRDVEGRSALLLGKAKDNNAAAAIGPFVRLFDEHFTLDDVRAADLSLTVDGPEGYRLTGRSSMREISRDPADIMAQAVNAHHPYPDGLVLYLGTMFAPVEDRDEPGRGFTHKVGDIVSIETPALGVLVNRVQPTDKVAGWSMGTADLMRNLAKRGLLA
ncbi:MULTISPECIES: fumarylacetoacetate hydrolase family protein [unclassified Aureimonas]|uniref:fumarylacetoacetate hydrolase family protein n=1 Tax=unclassified Aureimonas TaxID=2615206 RepID=UPI0006FD55E2|nr:MULTISPECIES: fumarylacetoacetate hydrolase family protein [unclassified Aureimonas]KQT52898.1 fumarylacetoacetate hydrolase [Aureimonas sp. Leaf427]KQT80357.1 fumarylacetoacetate hydrolase [Aureimonas sp. Leaf460]